MCKLVISVALLCGVQLAAAVSNGGRPSLRARQMELSAVPMELYRADCGMPAHTNGSVHSLMQEAQKSTIPGSGIHDESKGKDVPVSPTVLKDGFIEMGCIKDYMYLHGDKYGDNKDQYKLAGVSDVSIVNYEHLVSSTDRQPMTREVCFGFCRSVQDMSFFGITNGRDCYCAPYVKPMAGDSSSCEAPCDGNSATFCGGKTKSAVFAMHSCGDSAQQHADATQEAKNTASDITSLTGEASGLSTKLQSGAETLQAALGQVGDGVASDLMQGVKVAAGELKRESDAAAGIASKLTDLAQVAFVDGQVAESEKVVKQIDMLVAAGIAKRLELQELVKMRGGGEVDSEAADDAEKQYYPLMYFVDKDASKAPTTCGGDVRRQMFAAQEAHCARACDEDVHECVGYSFYESNGLCFLISKFKTATYYTKEGCAAQAKCQAKLSKFQGTTLKPDASGKCEQCLKKATNANRCF